MTKTYTGNRETFIKISSFLWNEGFNIKDATHIGNDRYEFLESTSGSNLKMGCHDIFGILAWIEEDKVKYRVKVVGSYCTD